MPSVSGSTSSSTTRSTSKTGIVPGMMGVYNQLLGLNQQNYQNILSGYQQGQQMLSNNLNNIYAGYGDIQSSVMHMLGVDGGGWGVATPAANAIKQNSQTTQGQTQQSLIDRGLGNSTIMASMTNQNRLQTNQAYGELGSKLANYAAGYESQIGLARQNAMMQGAGMEANMTGQYMGDLSHYQFQNTAGNLTGQFSQSTSTSQGQSSGMSVDPTLSQSGNQRKGSTSPGGGGVGQSYNGGNDLPGQSQWTPYSYQSDVPNLSSGYGNAAQNPDDKGPASWVNYGPMTEASGQTQPFNPGV